jgi:hypothetical protein
VTRNIPSGTQDTNIAKWLGSTAPTVGAKTSANSIPTVLATDQASIPVAATLSAETSKVIGAVNQGTNPWTVNLITGFALSATQTDRTQKTQITDGTRDGTVKAASTLPLLTDTAIVVTQRDPLPAGTNVLGHVIVDTTSTTAVTQATAANLNATVIGTKTNNNAAPDATNLGVLPVLATAADQSWTEGNLVLGSVDLSGFLRAKVSSWLGSTAPTVGSKTSANSVPVVIASDQSAIPISIPTTQSAILIYSGRPLPLMPCNAVRRTNCFANGVQVRGIAP